MTVEEITKTIQLEFELAHLRMREHEYCVAPLDQGYEAYSKWAKTDSGHLMYSNRWYSLVQLRRKLGIPEDPTLPEAVKVKELIGKTTARMLQAMPQEGDRA